MVVNILKIENSNLRLVPSSTCTMVTFQSFFIETESILDILEIGKLEVDVPLTRTAVKNAMV